MPDHRCPECQTREEDTDKARDGRANRKIEYRAAFRFAHFAQCSNLHIGQRSAESREQTDQAGKELVLFQCRAQHHDHAGKTGQHGRHQRALSLGLAIEQGAAYRHAGKKERTQNHP